jgi:hypothetical protein
VEQDERCGELGAAEIPEHASPARDRIKDIEKNLPRVLPLYAKRS